VDSKRVVVIGGGAAGFFAAITCAEFAPASEVVLLERGPRFLAKVRISGGGRCNVTHGCFDPAEFVSQYPRGSRELLGPFSRFQARDTVEWFENRGVPLKTEADGRVFPASDSADDVVDCLIRAAARAGVRLESDTGVEGAGPLAPTGFELRLTGGRTLRCTQLLIATGGCRTPAAGRIAAELGHTLEAPVPSLFSFHIETPWVRRLAGVSISPVEASVPGTGYRGRGALLFTHSGISGPAVLQLSAWGARHWHERGYRFPVRIRWIPALGAEEIEAEVEKLRRQHPARLICRTPVQPIPARLWENLTEAAGIQPGTRWTGIARRSLRSLISTLISTEFSVSGKSLNRDEFVTCGGIRLSEVDFRTMESRVRPGLYFAGEVLDIDGLTGGFNFQAAWTTGWLAGSAMALDESTADRGDGQDPK
jgi:predicted Rossmann fold flavoprotein